MMRTLPLRKLCLALALALALGIAAAFAGAAPAATVWAVGDGGYSGPNDDSVAQRIIDEGPFDRFLFLGDVYGDPNPDSATDYVTYYDPSYGRFKASTSPTPGDHEWPFRAQGYDPYFGPLAPQQPDGGRYYSFDLDGWHFLSLNSNTFQPEAGFSDPASSAAQLAWIGADLNQSRLRGNCTIAFVQRPRYSATTPVGDDDQQQPLWGALEGRALAVLAGHQHNYQRFVPKGGTVQWIVGTGGKGTGGGDAHKAVDPAGSVLALAASNDTDYGALRLRPSLGRLDFEFIAVDGSVKDSGSMTCRPHNHPPSASFNRSPGNVRARQRVQFTSTSSDPEGELARQDWDLDGDGEFDDASGPSSSATFQGRGTRQVALKVTDSDGVEAVATEQVVVGAGPRPEVSIKRPTDGTRRSRRLRKIYGKSRNADKVTLGLVLRLPRGRCRAFDGKRFRRASCNSKRSFAVNGVASWQKRLSTRLLLPSGRYRLTATAVGEGGQQGVDRVRFRVR